MTGVIRVDGRGFTIDEIDASELGSQRAHPVVPYSLEAKLIFFQRLLSEVPYRISREITRLDRALTMAAGRLMRATPPQNPIFLVWSWRFAVSFGDGVECFCDVSRKQSRSV